MIGRDPQMAALEISVTGSAHITGDREMLQVAFQNILMNAAQAMEGQGPIKIEITNTDDICRVAVIDQGPGMPADAQEKAFDAFFTTKHRGTGLGLPIARRVVESHGGKIHIELPPSGGTIFTVVLPTAR
jgi:signal transduction histidine kinase